MSDEQKIVDEVAEETSTKSSDEIKTETQNAEEAISKELPNRDIRTGMVIRVHERIKDITAKGEERERIQVFEGVVMGLSGKGISRTMTVRKDSKGFMVEKIFPLASPNIVKVEIKKQYKVRRAKLSFLRDGFKRKLKEVK
jgi:large subunit ribosomal protein L19